VQKQLLMALSRPRLGLSVALGATILLAATLAMEHLDRPRAADPGAAAAPTVSVVAGMGSRAWFVSPDVGWALVQVPTAGLPRMELHRTIDAGATWQRQLTWDGGGVPRVARFFDARHAFVVVRASGSVLRIFTTVDGIRWRGGASPSPAASISFAGADLGWAAYRQGTSITVDQTADGGRSWRHLTSFSAPAQLELPQWVEFVDADDGLMGGLAEGRLASLYATHDGGATWAPTRLPDPPERIGAGASSVLSGAQALPGGAVMVDLSIYPREGYRYARSYLYLSTDGGRSWSQPRALPGPQWDAVDRRSVIATSGQALFTSSDGGGTWRRRQATLPASRPRDGDVFNAFQFAAPAFLDGHVGWATLVTTQRCVGAPHPQSCAEHPQIGWAVVRSSDGGATWSEVSTDA